MTSLEDYDEFGNYIGADVDSDDEGEVPQGDYSRPPQAAPLEGYDEEPAAGHEENALMEIDGMAFFLNRLPMSEALVDLHI